MRYFRFAVVAALVCLSMIAAGCMKTWVLDFTNDKGGWGILSGWDEPGSTVSSERGLFLSGTTMRALSGFTGDLEFSVAFRLDADILGTLKRMDIYLGDGGDPSSQFIKCVFKDLGGISPIYEIYDNGTKVHSAVYVSGLKLHDLNVFKVVKKEAVVTMTMNGADLFEPFGIVNYSAPLFVPYIYVNQGSPDEDEELVLIKNIKMKYSGTKESIIP